MKVGQQVNYFSVERGLVLDATVVSIEGAMEEYPYCKVLRLNFSAGGQGIDVAGVHHALDVREGESFWMLRGDEVQEEVNPELPLWWRWGHRPTPKLEEARNF